MLKMRHRVLYGVVAVLALAGVLQAYGCGEEEAGGAFDQCIASHQGYLSCNEYCATLARACAVCGCPAEQKENPLCGDSKHYSAIAWKSSAACEGYFTTAFEVCAQNVFYDSNGLLVNMSVRCCCE
jgi:hypothetical protein